MYKVHKNQCRPQSMLFSHYDHYSKKTYSSRFSINSEKSSMYSDAARQLLNPLQYCVTCIKHKIILQVEIVILQNTFILIR